METRVHFLSHCTEHYARRYCSTLTVPLEWRARHSQPSFTEDSLEWEKSKLADLNKTALETQLDMMQSLQPTAFDALFVFMYLALSSIPLRTLITCLLQPCSNCPARLFDRMAKEKEITFFFSKKSLVWGLNPCHQTKGWLYPLKLDRSPLRRVEWQNREEISVLADSIKQDGLCSLVIL